MRENYPLINSLKDCLANRIITYEHDKIMLSVCVNEFSQTAQCPLGLIAQPLVHPASSMSDAFFSPS